MPDRIIDGGPAFPQLTFTEGRDGDGLHYTSPDERGLSKREYTAIHIAAAMAAGSARNMSLKQAFALDYQKDAVTTSFATTAVELADALLNALEAEAASTSDVEGYGEPCDDRR